MTTTTSRPYRRRTFELNGIVCRQCSSCDLVLPLTSNYFYPDLCRPSGLKFVCQVCEVSKNRRYDHLNRKLQNERKTLRRKDLLGFISEIKECSPCVDCGEFYPHYVMDWDHLPGETKWMSVSKMSTRCSRESILSEIAKCELVCANCHRERTHQRRDEAVAGIDIIQLLVEQDEDDDDE